jgi:hypothetical protein
MNTRPPTRLTAIALTAAIAVLLAAPTALWAAHQFTDVPDSHTFHNAIDWMKDNNITVGCNPPANTQYCPDDSVTRGQMAAFMKRLAENQVVDAASLQGVDPNAFLMATTIETSQAAGFWQSNTAFGPSTEDHFTTTAQFSGDGIIEMALATPVTVGATNYGLTGVGICLDEVGAGGFIDVVRVWQWDAGDSQQVFQDATNRNTAPACHQYNLDVGSGDSLSLEIVLAGGGTLEIGPANLKWTAGAGAD